MTSKGWAWIIQDTALAEGELMKNCLYIRPIFPSGEGMQAFAKKVSEYTKSSFNISLAPDLVDLTYSTALHDAIMLYANAVTKVMSDKGSWRDGKAVTRAVRNTAITGVGDRVVALTDQGDRIESYEMMNYVQEPDGRMRSVAIGMYNSTDKQYMAYKQVAVWPGGTTVVPIDVVAGVLPLVRTC